jgi:ketosteroid isomerase-like protein
MSAHSLLRWSLHWTCPVALVTFTALIPAVKTLAQPPKPQAPKPGMPRAERHESKHEIDQLEETWRNAILKHDATAMSNLLSDDYVGITARGTLQSKDDVLAGMRTGALQFTTLDLSDRKVRFYAQTAVVTSRAEIAGTSANGDVTGSYRYTRVYVRDPKGAWKVVSFEVNRIRDPGDRSEKK